MVPFATALSSAARVLPVAGHATPTPGLAPFLKFSTAGDSGGGFGGLRGGARGGGV